MAIPALLNYYTPEQYLAIERAAEFKSEYIDGEIVAMSGASREHTLIEVNVLRELSTQLKGRPCETYSSNMRVRVDAGLYTYPDASVVCGEAQFDDAELDTLLNPTVIFEALSPSTEKYDRGMKFARYRRVGSLRAHVLISQDRPTVEVYTRQGEHWLLLIEASGLDAEIDLAPIDLRLALREVYDRVAFGEPASVG